jgi:hypothetical protein
MNLVNGVEQIYKEIRDTIGMGDRWTNSKEINKWNKELNKYGKEFRYMAKVLGGSIENIEESNINEKEN